MAANTNTLVTDFVGQRVHGRAELVRALYAMLKDDALRFAQIEQFVPNDNEIIEEGRGNVINITNAQLRAFMGLVNTFLSQVEDPAALELISNLCIRSLEVPAN